MPEPPCSPAPGGNTFNGIKATDSPVGVLVSGSGNCFANVETSHTYQAGVLVDNLAEPDEGEYQSLIRYKDLSPYADSDEGIERFIQVVEMHIVRTWPRGNDQPPSPKHQQVIDLEQQIDQVKNQPDKVEQLFVKILAIR